MVGLKADNKVQDKTISGKKKDNNNNNNNNF